MASILSWSGSANLLASPELSVPVECVGEPMLAHMCEQLSSGRVAGI
jgi:hypothetical protein